MGEVVDVVNVSPDFRREEVGVERNLFWSRISIQPGKVGERKWLTSLALCLWPACLYQCLRLNHRGGAVLRNRSELVGFGGRTSRPEQPLPQLMLREW